MVFIVKQNKKKKKKGMLLASEMVKIVISVIAIGFLVYFLTMLYFSKVAEEKQVEAKAILTDTNNPESIVRLIQQIERREIPGNSAERQILNPKGWDIFAFTGSDAKPNSCINENCLCICDDVFIELFNAQIKECDEHGVCLRIRNLDPGASDIFGEGVRINPEKPHTSILVEYDESSNLFKIRDTTG